MKIRTAILVTICLTSVAAFGGEFQKAQDGKTLVWNVNPQPGDIATWSGKRDDNGYATGRGTLTWFHAQRKIVTGSNLPQAKYVAIASYTGEMAKGKLTGLVSATDANGKKFHGTYVDGRRTKWVAGVAAENSPNEQPAARRAEPVEAPAEGPRQPVVETKTKEPNATAPAEAAAPAPPEQAEKKSGEFDDSLRSLVGPPSGLRPNADASARSTSSSSASPAASVSPSPQ